MKQAQKCHTHIERISHSVRLELEKLNINLHLGEKVTEVTNLGITTHSGKSILSSLVVWAAGIKAPNFLKNIAGLETNYINHQHQYMSLRQLKIKIFSLLEIVLNV